jgi:colanic acid/amylovoran biosynthesis glycosyltransferase
MKPVIAHYQSTWLKLSENWIAAQINAIQNYQSIVLTKRERNSDVFSGPEIFSLDHRRFPTRHYNRLKWRATGVAPYFLQTCVQQQVRAIHAWFGFSGIAMLELARRLQVPLVTSFLGADFTRGDVALLRRRYHRLFALGDRFLAEGPAAAERLEFLGCSPAKISIARIAIDVSAYKLAPRGRSIGEPLHVLMAARFTEKKGFPDGVEAFCRFIRAGGAGRLAVLGSGDDREGKAIRAQLDRIVTQYGCGDLVDFAGWQDHDRLVTLLRASDVFMHPSVTAANGDAEGGHPVVLTEAAALGVALIGTRHCDIPELVQDNYTGWLVPEHDVDGLVVALRDAYQAPDKVDRFGHNARRLVEEKYNLDRQTLDTVYSRLEI